MTRSHPLNKTARAQLRALLTKHVPTVEPLIAELGQTVVACRAGSFHAYALTRNPPNEALNDTIKAEARFQAFVAESQHFWQAFQDHFAQSGDAAELARVFLVARLEPVAQAAGVPAEDTVRLFEDMVQALAQTPPESSSLQRGAQVNLLELAVAEDVCAALIEAGVWQLTAVRLGLFAETVRIVFKAAGLRLPRPREFLRLLYTAIPHAQGKARQGKARQGKARQGKA